jgi:hypothetical protein
LESDTNVASTDGVMATLSDLVQGLAGVTGLPEATVFAYGRFARQAGLISQKGRGTSAAAMTLRDVSNLLIGIGATGVTREAGKAIRQFRPLRGRLYSFGGALGPLFSEWWRPLGVVEIGGSEFGIEHELKSDFGTSFEHLIRSTLDGSLVELFRQIPVAEIPPELWKKWKREKNVNLQQSTDLLVERGLIQTKAAGDLEFGEDINLEVVFNRSTSSVDIEFQRMWDNPETIFVASFAPKRKTSKRRPDVRVEAKMTQKTLAAAALLISDLVKPAALRTDQPTDYLFIQQFRRSWSMPRM